MDVGPFTGFRLLSGPLCMLDTGYSRDELAVRLCGVPGVGLRLVPRYAPRRTSAVTDTGRDPLHTGEVQGSIPCAPSRTVNKIRVLLLVWFVGNGRRLAPARRTKHEMTCTYLQNPCSRFMWCSYADVGTGLF
jgi:hypothetical protein